MTYDTQKLCGALDPSRGYNMGTASGRPVWPQSPRLEDIRFAADVAPALSRICRFNGHIKAGEYRKNPPGKWPEEYWHPFEIYSVAQHALHVCDAVAEKHPDDALLQLAALHHDSHEYVLGDMVKPQKGMYAGRAQYERAWDRVIAEVLGISPDLFSHPAIKEADYRVFLTEKRDLLEPGSVDFGAAEAEPYDFRITPMLPSEACRAFTLRHVNLTQEKDKL